MHAPDGFLNAGTAVATGAVSLGVLAATLRNLGTSLKERQAPLAGIVAAFVFAAQMFNFPVAAGTSGHLLGGALAAVLLGPALGSVVVTVVVVVQALVFADGGLTALGYNIINMALVTAFGGYGAYSLFRKVLPANRGGVIGATGLAAGLSVVLSAMAFSLEWLFGATAPVPFDKVFGAMVSFHVLIGVGEGVISALAVSAVLAARPDLVYGARDISVSVRRQAGRVSRRVFVIAALVVTLVVAAVVSQFAVDSPDGLERVAEDTGILGEANPLEGSVFSDYAVAGLENPTLSLAIAGIVGALVVLSVSWGLIVALRRRKDMTV